MTLAQPPRHGASPDEPAAALTARGLAASGAAPHPLEAAGPRTWAGAAALALASGLALVAAFEWLGFPGLAGVAAALAAALLGLGWRRFSRSGGRAGRVPLVLAVLVAPLAVHGLARAAGLGHPFAGRSGDLLDWLAGPWFPVQLTLAAGAGLGLRAFGIPSLAWPLAAAAWLAAQDAAPLLFGGAPTWDQRALVSALAGLVLVAAGLATDRRTRGDVAFWLYLPGLLALTGGLATWTGPSDLALALVALLHAGLVGASLLLERRSFAVAGALGLAAAAGRLADDLLDAAALPFALAALALATAGLGLLYHRHQPSLAASLAQRVPGGLRRLLPPGVAGPR